MKSTVFVIARKELSAGLRGASFWLSLAVSAALAAALGALFVRLRPAPADERAARLVEILLLSTPPLAAAVSSGPFARERASGALETLLAAPVSDAAAVLGKFLAAAALCLGGTLVLALVAAASAGPLGLPRPDGGEIRLAAIGLAAASAAQLSWCACGLFFSLVSRREGGAAAATLVAAAASAIVAAGELPFTAPDGFAAHLDLVQFALGIADTRPVFAFLSAAAFFLFAAVRMLESRFWLLRRNP